MDFEVKEYTGYELKLTSVPKCKVFTLYAAVSDLGLRIIKNGLDSYIIDGFDDEQEAQDFIKGINV